MVSVRLALPKLKRLVIISRFHLVVCQVNFAVVAPAIGKLLKNQGIAWQRSTEVDLSEDEVSQL